MDKQGDGCHKLERTARIRKVADPRMSRSLEYGLAMLECFSAHKPALGIAELAKAIGIGRSTAHRYASTLLMLGYLEQDSKRKYHLATKAADIGTAAIGVVRLLAPARQTLEDLRDWTGHTVGMGVLDRTRALYVHRLHAHRAGQWQADLGMRVGSCVPLDCTAIGKALLAGVPEDKQDALLGELELAQHGPDSSAAMQELATQLQAIREQGLAISDEELAPGVRSIAAPVSGAGARAIAIDVTVPSSAYKPKRLLEEIGPLVQRAAQRISRAVAAAAEGG